MIRNITIYLYNVITRTTKYMYTQHHSYLYQNLATPHQAYLKSTALILQEQLFLKTLKNQTLWLWFPTKTGALNFQIKVFCPPPKKKPQKTKTKQKQTKKTNKTIKRGIFCNLFSSYSYLVFVSTYYSTIPFIAFHMHMVIKCFCLIGRIPNDVGTKTRCHDGMQQHYWLDIFFN